MAFQLDDLKPFIDWLYLHPGLAGLTVFIISCAESLAIIGLFIPGSIVMPAIGSLVGAGVLPGPLVLIAAILGAIVGDGLSYWLGYRFHEQIRGYWPFNRFPRVIKSGEQFFLKHGGLSVFIGRFVGPVRPIIPVVAGMMSMSPSRFLLANVLSAIAWAIVYMAPGFFLGAISEQLAPHTAARLLVILALFTLWVCLLWWITKRVWRWGVGKLQRWTHKGWSSMSQPASRFHGFQQALVFPNHPSNHKPLLLLVVIFAATVAFVTLAIAVQATNWLSKINVPIYYLLRSFELPFVDHFMAFLQGFGSLTTFLLVMVAVSCWLVRRHRWRALFCWWANFLSCWGVIACIKMLLAIPRPANSLLNFTTWSFPSLHGGLMMALVMGLIMLLLPHIHRRKWSKVILLGSFFGFIAGLPQLYFGFNWFSDELGGMLVAIGVGASWFILYSRSDSKAHLPPRPLLLWALLSFVMAGSVVAKMGSEQFLKDLKIQAIKVPFAMQDWWQGKPLPISLTRNNAFGDVSELLTIQYVGHLLNLEKALLAQGWTIVPKPSLPVILNRIGAKNRLAQLPLIPDLYQARKPLLIMTKTLHQPERVLVLRVWATTVVMMPMGQALWLGTVQYRKPWRFSYDGEFDTDASLTAASATALLATDLSGFLVGNAHFHLPGCSALSTGVECEQPALFVRSIGL